MVVRKGNWGVSYELPDSLYEELRKMAEEEKIPISQIIRRIIQEKVSVKNK